MKAGLKLGLKIAGLVIGVIFLIVLGFICLWKYENVDKIEDIDKYEQ